jgi:hypothetical protein
MPKKRPVTRKSKAKTPQSLSWDQFLNIMSRYVGQTAEFCLDNLTYSAEITRLLLVDGCLCCFCSNIYVFESGWQALHAEEMIFFRTPINPNPPVDLGGGTIKIITSEGGEAFLKMRVFQKRA